MSSNVMREVFRVMPSVSSYRASSFVSTSVFAKDSRPDPSYMIEIQRLHRPSKLQRGVFFLSTESVPSERASKYFETLFSSAKIMCRQAIG